MPNYKLTIAYDGRRYNGWQKQPGSTNTIQGKLEEICGRLLNEQVEVVGSGRTDAGVHAIGQVANVKTNSSILPDELLNGLNDHLPKDIRVKNVEKVNDRFHSRLNAVGKHYSYRIDNGRVADLFTRKYSTRVEKPLDVERMRQAAYYLIGEHDFTSFCTNSGKKKSKVRIIYSIDIINVNGKISIDIHGNGFLYNMIRIISGTLIEVGLGKKNPEEVKDILEALDRSKAGITAPSTGLFLVSVDY
ncbi:MAG: tRNA pseudouridine(38-40) synthase TruA [Lachnospira sp.]|nr:tRNA pseudouridine(38-40) synthase TruA [Lachnospira sp.]